MPDPITLATAVGAGLAGWFGGKRGGKRGAEDTLNATAGAVKRIERTVDTIATKVDGLAGHVTDVRERLSYMEGRLSE